MSAPTSDCGRSVCRWTRIGYGLMNDPCNSASLVIRNRMPQGPSERISRGPNAPKHLVGEAEVHLHVGKLSADDKSQHPSKPKGRRARISRECFWISDGREM